MGPNGQRAISVVSPGAVEYIREHGFPGTDMTFRNSSGSTLARLFCGCKERYSFNMLMMPIRAVVHESLLRDMPPDVIEWGGRVKSTRNGRRCNSRSQFRECGFRHRWRWGTKCCSRADFWGQISCRIRVSVHEIRGDFFS